MHWEGKCKGGESGQWEFASGVNCLSSLQCMKVTGVTCEKSSERMQSFARHANLNISLILTKLEYISHCCSHPWPRMLELEQRGNFNRRERLRRFGR